jgi:hypothetical protein
MKVHLAPIDIRSGNQGKVQRTRRLLTSSRGQWACEAMIRSFPGPFVNLPRGPAQMGLSWWHDLETRIPDKFFFLFSFYNTDSYTVVRIYVIYTLVASAAGYASAYLAYPVAPPLTSGNLLP